MFINGFNLGRYWTAVGPQDTLYVPANLLYSGQRTSTIIILELDDDPCDYPDTCFVTFQDTPMLNGPVKPLTHGRHTIGKPAKQWIAKYIKDWDNDQDKADEFLSQAINSVHRKVV